MHSENRKVDPTNKYSILGKSKDKETLLLPNLDLMKSIDRKLEKAEKNRNVFKEERS